MAEANSEFSVIQRYFAAQNYYRDDVVVGIGDDCALLDIPPGKTLAVSLDMLVENVHFFANTNPEALGHKALAVNLSDLAAQGAEPAWVTLGLTLPDIDEAWLSGFCRGFFALAERFQVQLVGGDTTHGALTIAVQAHGFVDKTKSLRRNNARPGDAILVTGTLGDAALALNILMNKTPMPPLAATMNDLQTRLDQPTPRVEQGQQLLGIASAAIDISDGLAQDLGHILNASGVGASIWVDELPLSAPLQSCLQADAAIRTALSGGDDYELCFTVPPAAKTELQRKAARWDCRCTQIGQIEAEPGLRLLHANGAPFQLDKTGYDHFTS